MRLDRQIECARPRVDVVIERIALRRGLLLFPGKMVIELAPRATPGKGAVILREAGERGTAAPLD